MHIVKIVPPTFMQHSAMPFFPVRIPCDSSRWFENFGDSLIICMLTENKREVTVLSCAQYSKETCFKAFSLAAL